MDYNKLLELDRDYGTPFYLLYPDVFKFNIHSFLSSFKERYERTIIGYSFKTNYVPSLCQYAYEEGCFAEVVSEMEYQLAEKMGFKNIIFNGPIKRDSILYHALDNHSIINIDSEYEIESVCKYKNDHPNDTIKVGLRINIMLKDANGNSTIQSGLKSGRFGFPEDILEMNINVLKSNGIIINSIHGHTSSTDRIPNNYKIISRQMLKVCEKYSLNDIEYFDVGGGFFGAAAKGFNDAGRPSYKDYADAIFDVLLTNNWFNNVRPYIVIEPGASVVANVFDYITKVYQTKQIGDVDFAFVDGTVFHFKPTMHPYNAPFVVHKRNRIEESKEYDVVGSTCMEKDIVLKNVAMPVVKNGDFIQIKGIGAYTISLAPTFINYLPPIISCSNGVNKEIRKKQGVDDILSLYTIDK